VANHAILNSTQKYGGSDLLTVMDTDLNDEVTSTLWTVAGMYFIIRECLPTMRHLVSILKLQ